MAAVSSITNATAYRPQPPDIVGIPAATADPDRHVALESTADIHAALAYAQAEGDIVCVHGRPGTGKTAALRRYAHTRRGAAYLETDFAVRTPFTLLKKVADALGIHHYGLRSSFDAEEVILRHLRGRSAILIVDGADSLAPGLLDGLRSIRDRAPCGLAFAGHDSLWLLLSGSRRCDQIVARIGARVALGPVPDEDVFALAESALGFRPAGKAADRLLAEARSPGGLHALKRLFVRASLIARAEERKVRAEDIAS